jgi:hypothetical protein
MLVEITVLIIALLAAIVIFRGLKRFLPLIINSLGALIVLWILNYFGLGILINIWSVLVVAIGGFAGLVLVVLLHFLGIAF